MCFFYNLEMMAEDLEKFIEDQKAKLAQDKAELENDPPYMEIRVRVLNSFSEFKHVSGVSLWACFCYALKTVYVAKTHIYINDLFSQTHFYHKYFLSVLR